MTVLIWMILVWFGGLIIGFYISARIADHIGAEKMKSGLVEKGYAQYVIRDGKPVWQWKENK